MHRKISVLIVDDSAMIRKVLSMGLSDDPDITVLGTASSAEMAQRFIDRRRPDVITLDLEMPTMDGLSFLRSYMGTDPIPTVVISSQTQRGQRKTMEAFSAGAIDVIPKPTISPTDGMGEMMKHIVASVKAAAVAKIRRVVSAPTQEAPRSRPPVQAQHIPTARMSGTSNWLIGIGASTGGVQALSDILPEFPVGCPPVLIVQHMPKGFTNSFAARLNSMCKVTVKEAVHGEQLRPSTVYIAPGGDLHMTVRRTLGDLVISLEEGEPVAYSRPSVDVLFNSLARVAPGKIVAALLTGMGRDGASGLVEIKNSGGHTMAQDEQSCVVFGMPYAAQNLGAVTETTPLNQITQKIFENVGQTRGAAGPSFARHSNQPARR